MRSNVRNTRIRNVTNEKIYMKMLLAAGRIEKLCRKETLYLCATCAIIIFYLICPVMQSFFRFSLCERFMMIGDTFFCIFRFSAENSFRVYRL